ncbi:MAG: hypothetical protein ACOYL6_12985 [Bacteriovoracaceae bacterium]
MKYILFLILFSQAVLANENPGVCQIGGYNYSGSYYSDNYGLPAPPLPAACKERTHLDAEKLGVEYRANNTALMALIDQILNDPKCAELVDVITAYVEAVKKMRAQYEVDAKDRLDLLDKVWKYFDMQRDYAHMAVFNSTCSGEEHRGAAMVNLDGINKIASASGATTQVTKNGQLIDDCANVEAYGVDDLSGFSVSMKKAIGSIFLFQKDAYSIFDQVILKTSSGGVLYDSGCKANAEQKNIPLSSLGSDKKVVVEIKGNCANGGQKGASAWVVAIQCQQKPKVCEKQISDLLELLKKEVEFTKKLIDIHATEMNCYNHYDKNVLKDLQRNGLISVDQYPLENGFCASYDLTCKKRQREKMGKETSFFNPKGSLQTDEKKKSIKDYANELLMKKKNEKPQKSGVEDTSAKKDTLISEKDAKRVHRNEHQEPNFNSKVIFEDNCPKKIVTTDSILKLISRTYCTVGFRKLGLDMDSFSK